MKIRFWGVRGSLPSPGPLTMWLRRQYAVRQRRVGSLMLIFDAGTGIRRLGQSLVSWSGDMCLFLSHVHWDHVQGFPFFAPLHQPGRELSLVVPRGKGRTLSRLVGMDGIHFPVTEERVDSRLLISTNDPMNLLARTASSSVGSASIIREEVSASASSTPARPSSSSPTTSSTPRIRTRSTRPPSSTSAAEPSFWCTTPSMSPTITR